MKIGRQFNKLSKSEYIHFVENHKKYTDFNTLGLYRSICENERLDLNDKIEMRDFANQHFGKTFNFLQLKDPDTYFELTTLGREMTVADERQVWNEIKANQQKILADKKIKHRNFGVYSKHNCGYEDCRLDGLMLRRSSSIQAWEAEMCFESDKKEYGAEEKSKRLKKQRKFKHKIISEELNIE
ncbi:MAG: hypothetical protein ACI81T_003530 [Bacteroidia bacterium]|jgi:hypothetical protein